MQNYFGKSYKSKNKLYSKCYGPEGNLMLFNTSENLHSWKQFCYFRNDGSATHTAIREENYFSSFALKHNQCAFLQKKACKPKFGQKVFFCFSVMERKMWRSLFSLFHSRRMDSFKWDDNKRRISKHGELYKKYFIITCRFFISWI